MNKAVGILDGNFTIREDTDSYVYMNKEEYFPKVIEKIDDILLNEKICQISKIIFLSLKVVFDAKSIFKVPNSSSLVPSEDVLYLELEDYIRRHPLFILKVEVTSERNRTINKNINAYKKENYVYYDYVHKSRNKHIRETKNKPKKFQ